MVDTKLTFGIKDFLRRLFNLAASVPNVHRVPLHKAVTSAAERLGFLELVLDVGAGGSPYKSKFKFIEWLSMDITGAVDIHGDICHLPIRDIVADCCVCTEVLEHVSEPSLALAEINRVLKEDAYLVLSTPLLFEIHPQPGDFTRWTDSGLKLLVEKAGFQVLQVERLGGVFSCIAGIVKRIPYQLLGPYSATNYAYFNVFVAFTLNLLLIPVCKLISIWDFLDRSRNNTLGIFVLAQKHSDDQFRATGKRPNCEPGI
jgi:SAM-dependent methyltransferase